MRAAIVLALVALTAGAARADDRLAPLRPKRDLPIVAVGAALYLVGEVPAKGALSPDACRWCDDNALDRGVRDALVWKDTASANALSNLTAFVAPPLVGAGLLELTGGLDGGGLESLQNAIILAEAGLLAADLDYVVKIAVARERPFVHQLPPADKPHTDDPDENNLSFYSGHSTIAMSLAVAAGTTATLRGYRHHRLVWAATVPFALATGYLRIAADRHWASDVVTGWITGAAIGFAVPYFFHRRCPSVAPVVARSSTSTTFGIAGSW